MSRESAPRAAQCGRQVLCASMTGNGCNKTHCAVESRYNAGGAIFKIYLVFNNYFQSGGDMCIRKKNALVT